MLKFRDGIVELYKKAATSIPPDIEEALKNTYAVEESPSAKASLGEILQSIRVFRQTVQQVCQETGIPYFAVKAPRGLSHSDLRNTIREATAIATEKIPLRPSAVDFLTAENSGDNNGTGFPIVFIEEAPGDTLTVDLMLRNVGCETIGRTYRLPSDEINAPMDLTGVRVCVLDAVSKSQGRGCPPYVIGVGVGAAEEQVSVLARQQLFRRIHEKSDHPEVADLEERLLGEINELGRNSAAFGRSVIALGVKIGINHRHIGSCCVHVSLSCWANKRARLIW